MTYASPTTVNMSKGMIELVNYVNSTTDQWLSNLTMIGVFILVLIGYYKARDDFGGAFAVSGFVTFVIGLLFWLGGFISGWAFTIVIGLAIFGVILILLDQNG